MINVHQKKEAYQAQLKEIEKELVQPDIYAQKDQLSVLTRRRSELEIMIQAFDEYICLQKERAEAEELTHNSDEEIREMAFIELEELLKRENQQERAIVGMLIPKEPADEKHAIIEIRAGTGGDEAALFSGVLFRMYTRYAERRNWKTQLIEENPTDLGGFKEVIFLVKGKGAYGQLKYEAGVHRVQRVPSTEASGRIHTSSASVVVLPEVSKDIEIQIDPEDLRIDVYRASGAGGQYVNRTESAVRITHIPSGIVVTCQNQRSQHQNKIQAMSLLQARLYERERIQSESEQSRKRKRLIGSGDRSEKIRTYNYREGRITDHRINFTSYQLQAILDGEMDSLFDAIQEADLQEALESMK